MHLLLTKKGVNMVDEIKEITDRIIPGVTWKQIAAIVGFVAVACLGYFNIRQTGKNAYEQSIQNSKTLETILNNQKENDRINTLRLGNIELDQREFRIRLTILEKAINK